MSRGGHVPPGRTRRSSTGQRVAGETGLHGKGLRGRAMHKSSLSPTGLGLLLWKATCRETCPCRLGRGQRKRTGRHLAGALLHLGEGGRKRAATMRYLVGLPSYKMQEKWSCASCVEPMTESKRYEMRPLKALSQSINRCPFSGMKPINR